MTKGKNPRRVLLLALGVLAAGCTSTAATRDVQLTVRNGTSEKRIVWVETFENARRPFESKQSGPDLLGSADPGAEFHAKVAVPENGAFRVDASKSGEYMPHGVKFSMTFNGEVIPSDLALRRSSSWTAESECGQLEDPRKNEKWSRAWAGPWT